MGMILAGADGAGPRTWGMNGLLYAASSGPLGAGLGAGKGQGRRPLTSWQSVNNLWGTEVAFVARAWCLPG